MRKILSVLFLFVASVAGFAQGKYAGNYKNFIGKSYSDSKNIQGLSGWKYLEGTLLTETRDEEVITVNVFRKGTTRLILFSLKEDTASQEFVINDLLQVTSVQTGWTIKTAVCRDNKINNVWLVALAKETSSPVLKTIKKVWRFNPDKRRIEAIGIQQIDCLNEGEEQY